MLSILVFPILLFAVKYSLRGAPKRRVTIGDSLILIAVVAVDITGFRVGVGPHPAWFLFPAAFVGLFLILVVSARLYLPEASEKIGLVFIYLLFCTVEFSFIIYVLETFDD